MMGTIKDKLNKLSETKELIRQAIEENGQPVPQTTPFSEYPDAIRSIDTGAGVDTFDATALPSDILLNKTAYVNGEKITGTIVSREASDLAASGATVSIPAGYYPSAVSKSVAAAEQAVPGISVSSNGLITASATQTAGYVAAGTKSATRQLTTRAAATITPGTYAKTAAAAGRYTTGAVTVAGDRNLVAGNIRSGVSIFGVWGNYAPAATLSSYTVTINLESSCRRMDVLYTDQRGNMAQISMGSEVGIYSNTIYPARNSIMAFWYLRGTGGFTVSSNLFTFIAGVTDRVNGIAQASILVGKIVGSGTLSLGGT